MVRNLPALLGSTPPFSSSRFDRFSQEKTGLPIISSHRDAIGPVHMEEGHVVIAETPKMPALDGVRVLVVDDDAGAREMVTAVLEYCGAVVMAAASAAEARSGLARSA